jgi:1-acyl-sn-glycerol-3-phosphate acyltransferase
VAGCLDFAAPRPAPLELIFMLLLRSLVFNFLLFGLLLLMGLLCAPLALWSANGAYWSIKTYCRIILRLLALICGLRTEVRGPVPAGDVLICSKHQSFLDIIMLSAALPRAKFVMKKELKWTPVVGFYAMRIGSTPVNRGMRSRAMKDMVSHATRSRDGLGQLVIYPQGTRVAPGARLPYKIGAGVLYSRFGIPCIPVATNAGLFWGRNTVYRRPGLAVIEFLPEMPAGMPIETFMYQLEVAVETTSDTLMQESGFAPASLAAEAEG